jgi:glycosyltransferase involved in cell wall biosynthesis
VTPAAAHPGVLRRVVVNGKFLSADSTGVHRVAEELLLGMHAVLAREPMLAQRLQLELWVPRDGEARAKRLGVPYRVLKPLVGIPWEQLTLPWHARGRLLLSLCNVGPMAARDAVTMFHDAQVHSSPSSYGRGFRAWYHLHQPIAGRRHRHILTVSGFSRGQLAHYGLVEPERVSVIHNGIDHMQRLRADDRLLATLGLTSGRYVVGLANTQAHKNVPLLLQAFDDQRLSGLKLVLFGSADAAAFERLGRRVGPQVVFAGRISDEQLKGLYQHALCMAFPSRTEGFGLPPLEAMMVGCPAVVAPCGALPEVCASAAEYASPDDVSAWVAAIARLAEDPAWRARRVQDGSQHASQMTWYASASRLVDVLLRV